MSESKTLDQRSGMDKLFGAAAVVVAIVLTIFHLLAASPLLTLNNTTQAVIHGGLVVTFFLLVRPMKFRTASRVIDVVLIVLTALAAYQVVVMRNSNTASGVLYSPYQRAISIVFVVVALIVAYRALGKILPSLCVIFLLYTLLGRYLPMPFTTARVTILRMGTYLMVGDEGLFGNALSTAANFIFLFVIFGSVLAFIGAGEFFVDISFAAFGKFCGGPAQAAVYSSMLMGMVNGSGAANVVTTGTFTIPLMKKTGFDSDTAGAVEACASNGGQIMPPVMGAVAFLMADATGLSYTTICLAALFPAILYYITLSTSIFSYAHKHNIPVKEPDPNAKSVWEIFKGGWFYFAPIIAMVGMLIAGLSTQRAALITIILCLVIGLITDHKKFTLTNLKQLCVDSANSIMTVSIACMIAGIIVAAINITGLGLRISGLITALSGGVILVMGVLTAIVCILLGMGLPTAACYIVLSVLVAPAMVNLGVATVSAHMFILYYGVVAAITPPVALAVFAAIGISGGDMWKTGLQAIKMAAAGFIIPFVFLYNTELLCFNAAADSFGITPAVILSVCTAAIGCAFMAIALFGWLFRDLKLPERGVLLACGILLMINEPFILNIVGLAVGVALLVMAKLSNKKKGVAA